MKKIYFVSIMILIVSGFLISACSSNKGEHGDDGGSAPLPETVSAEIQVSDGESSTSRSATLRVTGNTFAEIAKITVSVMEGSISHISNQNLIRDSTGNWKGTLASLPTGVTLTFSGNAYGPDNVTRTFSGTFSMALSASGSNVIGLKMYPESNMTTQSLPVITGIIRPFTMNVGTTATVQVSIQGNTNEVLNYRFLSGGGSFNPGGCDPANGCDNTTLTGVDLTLNGTTATISSTYTAPIVIPSSGRVYHTVRITNSQNNAVEVRFSIRLTNGASGTGTYSMEPVFAPVVTGLTAQRGDPNTVYDNSTGNGVNPNFLHWQASVDFNDNATSGYYINKTYNWSFPGATFCQYYSWNPSYCYSPSQSNSTASMTPYSPDNTTGTLTFQATKSIIQYSPSYQVIDNITTTVHYQVPLGLFPNNVIQ